MPTWARNRLLPWILLLVSLGVPTGRDAALLFHYPVAVGIDGYYYVLQIDSLKNTHHLYFRTRTPLVLYILTVISYFTKDSVTAVKVGTLLFHAVLCLGIFALMARATGDVWIGVLASALAGILGLHLYMIAEFINALGALTFLVWSGWFAVRWVQTRRAIWIGLVVVLLTAAVFSHQLAVALILTVAVSFALFQGLISSKSKGRLAAATLIVVVAIYFAPALIKVQSVIDIPDRLRSETTASPHLPIQQSYLSEALMLAVLAPLTSMLIMGKKRMHFGRVGGAILGAMCLWSLIVTLNPFLNPQAMLTGLAGRLRTLAYVQVALILPALIWLAYSLQRKLALYFAAAFLPLMIASIIAPLPYGLQSEFLARRETVIHALKLHGAEVGRDSIVIARHGDQFTVTSTLRIASQRVVPESSVRPTIYWLLDTPTNQVPVPGSVLLVDHSTLRTILVEDGALRLYLRSATNVEKRTLLSYNSHLVMAYNRGGSGNPFG